MTNAIVPNLTELTADRSSQIAAIGYDAEVLFVQFRRGGLYAYDEVTPGEYEALMAAPSLASHFAQTIKGIKPYKQIAPKEPDAATSSKATTSALPKVVTRPPNRPKTAELIVEAGRRVVSMSRPAPATAAGNDDMATEAVSWRDRIVGLVIDGVEKHAAAQEMLLRMADFRRRIVETWAPMKADAFRAHQTICKQEKGILAPLDEADTLLRRRIGEYSYAQLKAAQAEDERRRLTAEAEARQRAILETEENALAAAEELVAMGDPEGAEAVLEAPMPVAIRYEAPMPVQPAVASVAGVSGSITYEATIHDLSQVPREYLVIDVARTEAEIARRARQAQGRMQVPGVTIRETYATRRVGVRGRG